MYLNKDLRGLGLGRFLLTALEERVRQLGYPEVVLETSSSRKEAVELYQRCGYIPFDDGFIETERCDIILKKNLGMDIRGEIACSFPCMDALDHQGFIVLPRVQRSYIARHNLIHRRAVSLVVNHDGKVFVQALKPQDFFSDWSYNMFVGGDVYSGESPVETATREVANALGPVELRFELMFDCFCETSENRSLISVFRGEGNFFDAVGSLVTLSESDDEMESNYWLSRSELSDHMVGNRYGAIALQIWKCCLGFLQKDSFSPVISSIA
uniref:Nudix hydrolase domain-containing protein n=1 Tax=Compsopogon caeruleus TaxID=31354 RepID=A0A7S1TGF5_9RHOD